MKKNMKIWYLEGPFFRYEEDVKELAAKAGVRIIDANVTKDRTGACDKPPKVTLKAKYAPKASK